MGQVVVAYAQVIEPIPGYKAFHATLAYVDDDGNVLSIISGYATMPDDTHSVAEFISAEENAFNGVSPNLYGKLSAHTGDASSFIETLTASPLVPAGQPSLAGLFGIGKPAKDSEGQGILIPDDDYVKKNGGVNLERDKDRIKNAVLPVASGITQQQWNDIVNAAKAIQDKGLDYLPTGYNSNYLAAKALEAQGLHLPAESFWGGHWLPHASINKTGFVDSFLASMKQKLGIDSEPLVLDLTGDGVKTTGIADGAYFDLDNNGFAEQAAWVGDGTGILVNDPSGGPITNGSQLFGTSTSLSGGGYAVDGFSALADLDSNGDGVIDASDIAWSGLRVWVDADDKGIVDNGELLTMSEAGIASISLTTENTDVVDESGNYISKTASYSLVGGGIQQVVEYHLACLEKLVDVLPVHAEESNTAVHQRCCDIGT